METVGLAPEGCQLIDYGLSTDVVEIILNDRAPSTRKPYVLTSSLASQSTQHHIDPVNWLVGSVLEFLQECLLARLSPAIAKFYLVAFSSLSSLLTEPLWGGIPLSHFMCQIAEVYLQTASSFLGSFHSPGRLISGSC